LDDAVPKVADLLMLGVGTVFSTLGLVLLVPMLISLLVSPELPSLEEFGLSLVLYGGFGAVIACVICLVGAIPLVLLFRLVFSRLRRRGHGVRRSAMITSGGLALLGTLVVMIAATASGMIFLPAIAWPIALVPAAIATGLSTLLSFDQEVGK
jgi:hypothetical protein